MLSNANLNNKGWLLKYLFRGSDSDFNMRWFQNEGPIIVNSMIINCFVPPIIESAIYLVRKF
jgi:hypothetical protein